MPAVSVIMPVFNTASNYLKEAINSIISQSFGDWELLIIDDGSTDQDTLTCLKSYESYPKIRIFHHERNLGISQARNRGLSEATGTYIAMLDSDDIAHPDRFAVQVKYLTDHPECGCLGSLVNVIGDDKFNGEMFHLIEDSKSIELTLTLCCCCFCCSSVMLKKSVIDENHIRFRSEFDVAEDYDLWCQMIGKTEFKILTEHLVSYRFHFQNATHTQQERMKVCTYKVQASNLSRLLNCNITTDQCECLFTGRIGRHISLTEMIALVMKCVSFFESKAFHHDDLVKVFLPRIRNLFYHTRGLKAQLELFRSPLSQYFNLPLTWRLFCLITRGVL